jgi:hypothetical protein
MCFFFLNTKVHLLVSELYKVLNLLIGTQDIPKLNMRLIINHSG